MGEYGSSNINIEKGWQGVHKGCKDTCLCPRHVSSLYYTSEINDGDLMYFGMKIWGIKAANLMLYSVYGIETNECT